VKKIWLNIVKDITATLGIIVETAQTILKADTPQAPVNLHLENYVTNA